MQLGVQLDHKLTGDGHLFSQPAVDTFYNTSRYTCSIAFEGVQKLNNKSLMSIY